MGNIVVAPPNSAVIVSGCRGNKIVLGRCGFAFWFIEEARSLSLEIMTITVTSQECETTQGVKINLQSYAQVKVKSLKPDGTLNMEAIQLAATNFLSASQWEIQDALQNP